MPVTLEQARLNTQDDIQAGVIDEFRKNSMLLNALTFDDAVTPGTNGGTMTYGYTRVKTESGAGPREINTEYTASEAEKERHTVDLKILGGAYKIDRVILRTGGLVDEAVFQSEQKVKSTIAEFSNLVINGDIATDGKVFDGIDTMITGSSTEFIPGAAIDLSTDTALKANASALLNLMDEFLGELYAKPNFIFGNSKLIAKIKSVARAAGYYTRTEDAFGKAIDAYDGIPLIDLGEKPASNDPIIGIDSTTGETPLYAVCLGMDQLHGIGLSSGEIIQAYLPDLTQPGAVKTGEIEMVTAIALRRTRAAGVVRKIKVR